MIGVDFDEAAVTLNIATYENDMSSDRGTKKVYVGVMKGRRPKGRHGMRWMDTV